MKKALLVILACLSAFCLKAQIYTSGHLTVTFVSNKAHDSTYCQTTFDQYYDIIVDTSFIGDSLMVVDTSGGTLIGMYYNTTGASPWHLTTPMVYAVQWDYPLLNSPGYSYFPFAPRKIVRGIDTLHTLFTNDSFYVHDPCSYGMVSGNIYADNNMNCIFDAGDYGLGYIELQIIEYLSSPMGTDYSWWTGSSAYSQPLQKSWMTSYTVSLDPSYAFIFPGSPCSLAPYTFTTLPQSGVDFPLLCTSNIDVQCYPLSPATVRLHTPFFMQPYVSNTGCDIASGTLTLIKDSRVIYDPLLSTHPADTVYGDTLIWVYSNLSNISSGGSFGPYWNSFMANIYLTPDTTVTVGDTLCFRTYTNIPSADINPFNNDQSICLPVVYSFDPNIKEVSPKGTGPQGYVPGNTDTLTYTLHFQNTGSAEAYDIHIIDTLDSHINPNSLKILGTSHNMSPKWLKPGVVEFDFDNIMLPDSTTNEPASHGQVQFSVVLNTGLPVGTQIRNTGYIYFDLNPPVITNTTLTTIQTPNIVAPIAQELKIKLYPNPATTNINITASGKITSVAIYNLVGQEVHAQNCNTEELQIPVAHLPTGIYLIKINGTEIRKFVKE